MNKFISLIGLGNIHFEIIADKRNDYFATEKGSA